jgi:hypothetical protein
VSAPEAVERTEGEREEQLGWERRFGPWAGAAAIVSAVALFVGQSLPPRVDAPPERRTSALLLELDRAPGRAVASVIALAIGYALLGAALVYLYRAAKFRRPQTLTVAFVLAILGAAVGALVTIVSVVIQLDVASEFASSGPRTERRADDLLAEPGPQIAGGLLAGGTLALAFAVVLVSINAMRAGLLSRFMGFFGAFAGVILVIPLLLAVPSAWLVALGVLFLGRWPGGGRGPAWETGDATPWPSALDRREQLEAEQAARDAGLTRDEDEEEPPDEQRPAAGEPGAPPTSSPASGQRRQKRKRKKRR